MTWKEDQKLFAQNAEYQRRSAERAAYANPELANNLSLSFQMNPNLSPDQITGLAFGGGDLSTAEFVARERAKMAVRQGLGPDGESIRRQSEEERDQNFLGKARSATARALKITSRTAFTIFDTSLELAQSAIRAGTISPALLPVEAAKRMLEPDDEMRARYGSGPVGYINFLLDIPTGTTAWVAAEQILSGEGLDIGSGYLVGGEVEAEQSRRQRDILGSIQQGDELHAWTMGRQLSRSLADAGIINENSWAWNVASGTVDAIIAVVADPSNIIPGIGWGDEVVKGLKAVNNKQLTQYTDLISRANKLEETGGSVAEIAALRTRALQKLGANEKFIDPARTKNLNPNEILLRSKIMEEAGLIAGQESNLKTVNQASFMAFLTQKSGRRLVEKMVDETSANKIQLLHRNKLGFLAATDMAKATTPEEVVSIYARAITNPGEDKMYMLQAIPDLGIFRKTETGLYIRNTVNPFTKFGRMLPADTILDPTDGLDYITKLRQIFSVLPVNITDNAMSGRYVKVLEEQLFDEVIEAFASGSKAEIYGVTVKVSDRLAETFKALGYTDSQVKALTTWKTDSDGYITFAMKNLTDGEKSARVPLLVSQLITGGVAIIDPAAFKQIMRDAGRFKQIIRTTETDIPLVGSTLKYSAAGRWWNKSEKIMDLKTKKNDLDIKDVAGRTKLDSEINKLETELSKMRTPDKTLPLALIRGAGLAGDWTMTQVWKPLQLVRAAFIARVVMEESLRVMASGTFGGRAGLWDYMRASFKSDSYSIDAAGRRFNAKVSDADGLHAARADLVDEVDNLKKASKAGAQVDPVDIDNLNTQISNIQTQIDFIENEILEAERFYRKALLNKNRGEAYSAIVKNPKRVLINNRTSTIVNRFEDVSSAKWNEALAVRLDRLNADDIMKTLAKGVKPSYQIEIGGIAKRADEWYQIGIGDDQVFSYWLMQSKVGQEALEQISEAYKIKGLKFDKFNFDDVNAWTNRMTDELLYTVGGTRNALGQIIDFDSELLEVVKTGRFGGRSIIAKDNTLRTSKFDQAFLDKIETFRNMPATGTTVPPQFLEFIAPATYGSADGKGAQKVIEYFFSALYGTTSDKLARSPTFRRIYWKQMSELAESMDPTAAKKVLDNARKAGIDKKLVDNLEMRLKTSKGDATFTEIDNLAKGAALAATRDLLFDATKRGAGFDQMRLIMPFGDAWKEVTQTWGRLFVEQRGANLFRGMRNGRAAMGADAGPFGPGDLYGIDEITGEATATPDGKREPWLYTDQTTGEKRIQLAGSRQLSRLIGKTGFLGEAVEDFTGVGFGVPLQNLSMAGDMLPGIGPIADYVINDLIPNDPTFDWVREALFPFGAPADPQTPGGKQTVSEVILPAWAKKMSAILPEEGFFGFIGNLINDLDDDQMFVSTVNQVYSSLISTGNYDTSEIGQIKAIEDARRVGRKIYALRGLAQFIGPGSPLVEYMASTPDGDVMASLVTEHLRATEDALIAQGQSPTMALPIIMETYGPDIWMYAAPNSQSEYKGLAAKDSWWDWYRTDGNGDAVKAYGLVGGFFGPDEGEFSINAFSAMRNEGLSKSLTPKQRYEIAARALGYIAYNRVRDALPPESQRSNMDQILLGQTRRNIEQHFNIDLQSASSVNTRKRQINQAIEMIEAADRGEELAQRLMSQPMGESLRIYIGARQRIEQMSIESLGSTNWQRRKDGAYMREFLRNLGLRLSEQDPGFSKMYQYVFDGEMMEDLEVSR